MSLVTLARDLHRRRARERTGLCLVEGVRTVEELLASDLELRGALIAPSLASTERGAELGQLLAARGAAEEFVLSEVDERSFASAAATDSPQGVVAVAVIPERSFKSLGDIASEQAGPLRIVVLDAVQDPGNVGTILRTAEAFGVTATVALGGTADLWNPKVVRSAMGALFRQQAFAESAEALLAFCESNGFQVWAADGRGDEIAAAAAGAPNRLAIVLGNEGSGVSVALSQAVDRVVAIPIRGVESLNVAVATGILLYALSK